MYGDSVMADGRSNRKSKVISFIDRLEQDRNDNFDILVAKAKMLELEGFDLIIWEEPTWRVTAGRLTKLTGKNIKFFIVQLHVFTITRWRAYSRKMG